MAAIFYPELSDNIARYVAHAVGGDDAAVNVVEVFAHEASEITDENGKLATMYLAHDPECPYGKLPKGTEWVVEYKGRVEAFDKNRKSIFSRRTGSTCVKHLSLIKDPPKLNG